MDKSLGTLLRFWDVSHPTNNVGRVYTEFFFQVSTLDRVRGGRTARKCRKGCTVLRGNREMTEKKNIEVLSHGLLSRIVVLSYHSSSFLGSLLPV